jgi:putative oxidoreductase
MTRFWSTGLAILTVVAIAAVHWPAEYDGVGELLRGYAISDKGYGNYKLPLILLVMLLPLIFSGAGKASLDHVLRRWFTRR